jgi:hypothetical protein
MTPFRKVHGAGNDFILLADPHETRDWGNLAASLCHRRMGVGGDGVVVSERISAGTYTVTCYNSDGSVASMCGNALRCVARCAAEDRLYISRSPVEQMSITAVTRALAGLGVPAVVLDPCERSFLRSLLDFEVIVPALHGPYGDALGGLFLGVHSCPCCSLTLDPGKSSPVRVGVAGQRARGSRCQGGAARD